jgi:hypothetical protein
MNDKQQAVVIDPKFPSVVVQADEYSVEDKDVREREKPDFVKADDASFGGREL